ncbi:hypothetical protein HN415_09185 [Candidatus Woesearchaeota archaeon]|jgi:hypothetical protein|nr:hypothetical protein [Candidatus Woesearchaeota archaeon]
MAVDNSSIIDNSTVNSLFSSDLFSQISLSNFSFVDFINGVKPLMLFVIAMTIYAIFIFKFYKFLARRDIIQLKKKYYEVYEGFFHKVARSIFYFVENLVLIPLLVFFWFAVLSALLMFLSRNPDTNMILLTSASIVAAVRITAYYNENLSQDLAKMIPFALLGVFLVDISFFSVGETIETAKQLPSLALQLIYYLLFVTLLEFVMRITHGITSMVVRKEAKIDEDV